MRIGLLGMHPPGDLGFAVVREAVVGEIRRCHPRAIITCISLASEPTSTADHRGIRATQEPVAVGERNGVGVPTRAARGRFTRMQDRLTGIGSRCVAAPRGEFLGLLRAASLARRLDLLIILGASGADDLPDDAWRHAFALARWTALARTLGTPVALVNIGGAPRGSPLHRGLAKVVLWLAAYRSFRDLSSKVHVTEATGFQRDDPVVPDPAFGLWAELLPMAPSGAAGHLRTVAICPSPRPAGRTRSGGGGPADGRYADHLGAAAAALVGRGYAIEFVGGGRTADRLAIDVLREATLRHLAPNLSDRIATVQATSIEALLASLSRGDYVIASRYHAALLAQVLGKPTLALARPGPVWRLMRDAGVGEHCLDIETAGPDEILRAFSALERERVAIQERLTAYATACRGILDREFRALLPAATLRSPSVTAGGKKPT